MDKGIRFAGDSLVTRELESEFRGLGGALDNFPPVHQSSVCSSFLSLSHLGFDLLRCAFFTPLVLANVYNYNCL